MSTHSLPSPQDLLDAAEVYAPSDTSLERPPYPVNALPPAMRRSVLGVAEGVGVDPALAASVLIAACGAGIGKGVELELKKGFHVGPRIWACDVAPVGSGKTPAQQAMLTPFRTLQREAFDRYEVAVGNFDEWESAGKQAGEPRPSDPQIEHFFTTDYTMEALSIMFKSSSGLLLQRDELPGLVNDFDRYGKGGDRQRILSSWSGAPWKSDRAGRASTYIEKPVLNIHGGVQPDMLGTLAGDVTRSDGFVERIAWSWPHERPMQWNENVIADGLFLPITDAIRQLRGSSEPVALRLEPKAKNVFTMFYTENADLVSIERGPMRGATSKLPTMVAAIALILHCMNDPEGALGGAPVPLKILEGALAVARYHHAHARYVFNAMIHPEVAEKDTALERLLTSCLRPRTRSELLRDDRHLSGDGLDQLVGLAHSRGWLTTVDVPTNGRYATTLETTPEGRKYLLGEDSEASFLPSRIVNGDDTPVVDIARGEL